MPNGQPLCWGGPIGRVSRSHVLLRVMRRPKGKNRTGVEAGVCMRKTVLLRHSNSSIHPKLMKFLLYIISFKNVSYPLFFSEMRNVSYPHKPVSKMFHNPVSNPGKCFIPRNKILRPGMQCKKWTTPYVGKSEYRVSHKISTVFEKSLLLK